ncbi:phosphatase PAP2 family protein [Lewinella sp. JB7]|uniref:phosphatase PAP2 family protein n=1 Tax=Lewinella sp. JB7 TaxID=2962887 RepID=UPI0020C9C045|nr:phosphatase PAP2 family protein [Lewinella sp. JB7]MCP9234728.1 phosphatase PAP2 family protein [Lewinella sp. JB7]
MPTGSRWPYLTTLVILLLFLSGHSLLAQDSLRVPYRLSWETNLTVSGMAAGSVLFANELRNRVPEVLLSELRLGRIPPFDQFAVDYNSESARKASNRTRDASTYLPLALLLGKGPRRDIIKLALLYGQTVALRRGLTNIVKYTVRRPRPYLHDPSLAPTTVVRSYDREAFLSGHTSGSAATAFFFGRVFADYYPDSKLKPYIWTLSASLPALTGYFRIRAGQHYPSDVIAGYVLGAVIGYTVPILHRIPIGRNNMVLSPTGTGFYLSYRF